MKKYFNIIMIALAVAGLSLYPFVKIMAVNNTAESTSINLNNFSLKNVSTNYTIGAQTLFDKLIDSGMLGTRTQYNSLSADQQDDLKANFLIKLYHDLDPSEIAVIHPSDSIYNNQTSSVSNNATNNTTNRTTNTTVGNTTNSTSNPSWWQNFWNPTNSTNNISNNTQTNQPSYNGSWLPPISGNTTIPNVPSGGSRSTIENGQIRWFDFSGISKLLSGQSDINLNANQPVGNTNSAQSNPQKLGFWASIGQFFARLFGHK